MPSAGVLRITLNRPQVRNALRTQTLAEIAAELAAGAGDDETRAYLAEVGKLALAMPGGVRKTPRAGLTRAEMDARLAALREQAERITGER